MVDVVIEYDDSPDSIIITPQVTEQTVIVVPATGDGGGSGGTFQNVFLSTTDPGPGLEPGFLYVWFVLDGSGSVIDIRKGVA